MADSSPALSRRALLRAIATGGALVASAVVVGCATGNQEQGNTGKHKRKRTHDEQRPQGVAPSNPAVPGTLIMIIRHGEKPDEKGGSPGVDINGNPADDSSLTQVGWNRARRLVDVFDPQGAQPPPGLARPKAIYAAGATETGDGERTRETVTPLAQHLRMAVDTTFGKGDEAALVAQSTSTLGPALICWQHGEIPAIAQAFGAVTPTPPSTWPDDRFDVIWTLTATSSGWDFAQIPEMVLDGDQPQTISG
jgi:hypothetical protein